MKDRFEKIKLISEKLLETPCAKIARLWEELDNYVVRCNLCERRCVIPPGKRGMCGARYNHGGTLYVLTYGNISSMSNNPMAKKPFNNFFPNEYALTIGSWGCNFVCSWCQNWEITTLIIPNVNDSEKCFRLIARKIKNQLGAKTPWHVTRYFASYKARERGLPQSTPIEIIELARKVGIDEGLEYVYVGNIPNHPWEDTYCPNCGRVIIKRSGLWRVKVLIDDNRCPSCGSELAVTFRNKDGKVIRWDPVRDILFNEVE